MNETCSDLPSLVRNVMAGVASSVVVIATRVGDLRCGMTATAFTSVSLDPVSILVCINNRGAFHSAVHVGNAFTVNILGSHQTAVSKAFSGSRPGEQRFEEGCWGEDGDLPYLVDAQANLFCKVRQSIACGTHTIFIADVESARHRSFQKPLLYMAGAYGSYERFDDVRIG